MSKRHPRFTPLPDAPFVEGSGARPEHPTRPRQRPLLTKTPDTTVAQPPAADAAALRAHLRERLANIGRLPASRQITLGAIVAMLQAKVTMEESGKFRLKWPKAPKKKKRARKG